MALFGLFGKKKQTALPDDSMGVLKLWQTANAEQDWDLVFRTAQRLVDDGLAFHWSLGECYMHGRGVKKDPRQAMHHFELALETGSSKDMGRYADLLNDGVYLKQDKDRALCLYRTAAANEDPHSCLHLYRLQTAGALPGEQYSTDELAWMIFTAAIEREPGAIDLFNKHALEYTQLADYCYNMAMVANDKEFELKYTKLAASYGNVEALFYLGILYDHSQDPRMAARYWEAAGNLYEYPSAMFNLGILYEENYAFWDNWEENMLYWYTRAAEAGHGGAANNIGTYYKKKKQAKDTKSNTEKALHWFHRGAELGSPIAMYNLYVIYKNNNFGKQDFPRAMDYLRQSAALGYEKAVKALADLNE